MTAKDTDLINAIGEVLATARPEENTEDMDAIVPAASWRKLVDIHARAMYERNHSPTPSVSQEGDVEKPSFDHHAWFTNEWQASGWFLDRLGPEEAARRMCNGLMQALQAQMTTREEG